MALLMIGAGIALFSFIVGCVTVTIVTNHAVSTYVSKLTPEQMRDIYNSEEEEERMDSLEESMWARMVYGKNLSELYDEEDNDG